MRHACTDHYAANGQAERALNEPDWWPDWIRNHSPCDIHKLAGCLKKTLQPLESDVAGVLAAGLGMADICSAAKLRRCLSDIFVEGLVVEYGPPPASYKQLHEEIYDLLLTIRQTSKPSAVRQNQLRRYILASFVNGHPVQCPLKHYCSWSCCEDYAATISNFKLYSMFRGHSAPSECPCILAKIGGSLMMLWTSWDCLERTGCWKSFKFCTSTQASPSQH